MRHSLSALAALTALALVGCTGSGPATPSPTTSPAALAPPADFWPGAAAATSLIETQAGRFRLDIDPAALTATATPVAVRSLAANDDVYDLSIANFTKRDTFTVRRIERTATTLDITYDITHPFAAPTNLAGPATAANRADLGIAGRVLFLLDVPTATGNSYLTGVFPAIANTATIANADGFYKPGELLPDVSLIADTFPFKLLVDESGPDGARNGISNGGLPTGNYNAGIGGWQQANIGPSNDAWTGYGVLHQGQSARNTLSIRLSALSGPLSLESVILAKYNDPRQGINASQKRANRLPKNPPDPSQFAYRMPHGALDVESLAFLGTTDSNFLVNTISAATLNFRVVDWDARAFETAESDLALDPVVTNVAAGESGPPTLYVSIPDILGSASAVLDPTTDLADDDSAFGGDPDQDSGEPGDALYFTKSLTHNTTSGQSAGTKTGMVLALDTETTAATAGWHFQLRPDLTPLSTVVQNHVLQAFEVELFPLSAPPTATFTMLTPNVVSGGSCTVQASGYSDPEGDTIQVRLDWNNDGDFNDPGETGLTLPGAGGPPVNFTSPISYTYGGGTDTRQVPGDITDGANPPAAISPVLTFNVIPSGTCGAPFSSITPFTAGWSTPVTFSTAASGVSGVNWAYGAYRVPTLNHPAANTHAGWVYQQRITTPTFSQHIYRAYMLGPNSTDGVGVIPLTNAPGILGSDTTNSRQVHAIDVDSTGRVIFATRTPGTNSTSLATRDLIYTSGEASFRYFNSDGGATLALDADITTVATPHPVIALCVDQNDNVLTIDNQHVLRKWLKTSGYTEDTSAPFPLNLTAPPVSLDLTQDISDLDLNFHNQALFIVSETTGGIERLYRIECDGTFQNPVSGGGGANPLSTELTDFVTQGRPFQLTVDNYDTTGGLLPDAADVQMVVLGFSGTSSNEAHFFTSQLIRSGGSTFGIGTYLGTLDIQRNWIVARAGSAVATHRVYPNPPAGWQ
ncbi:MAG: hypothetical protein GEEBNDBF_02533 [bacterium]|nr:hypothetical protein [bacterium]